MDYDVVVAGYGYAGGIAVTTANDSVAKTIILEKMSHFGGNSTISGGNCVVADAVDEVLKYLRRTCMNTTDDEVLQAFAQGMGEMNDRNEMVLG